MLLGMPISLWMPWFIGVVALGVCWWLGVVYWGKLADQDEEKDKK